MLSLTRIRNNPDLIKAGLEAKNESINLDEILKLDEKHRDNIHQLNEMRAERNRASEEIAGAKRAGKNFDDAIAEMKKVSDAIKKLEKEVSEQGQMLNEQIDLIPNVPHDTVPVGQDENANQVIREWGEPPAKDFDLKSHVEIGLELNLFDLERGSKISGSGFPLLTGLGAKLERVLINYMLDIHVQKHGFTEIFPPFLTRA